MFDETYGKVHAGSATALDQVWMQMEPRLFWLGKMGYQILLTGHSLGASITNIATGRLLWQGTQCQAYTFGSFRSVCNDYVKLFNICNPLHTIHRYVNNNDIIPRLPPRISGYSHIGQYHYFTEHGYQDDHIGWAAKLRDMIDGRIKDLFEPGTDGIKDHAMVEYLKCLNNNLVD